MLDGEDAIGRRLVGRYLSTDGDLDLEDNGIYTKITAIFKLAQNVRDLRSHSQ